MAIVVDVWVRAAAYLISRIVGGGNTLAIEDVQHLLLAIVLERQIQLRLEHFWLMSLLIPPDFIERSNQAVEEAFVLRPSKYFLIGIQLFELELLFLFQHELSQLVNFALFEDLIVCNECVLENKHHGHQN